MRHNPFALKLLFWTTGLFASTSATAQLSPDSIAIAKYKADKACAISYTFDDGVLQHYTMAYPKLERLGFKGTYWINGNSINEGEKGPVHNLPRISWKDLKTMADHGQEISNHGWSHKNLVECTPAEVQTEIAWNDSIIEAKIGQRPVTYCYAGNKMNSAVVRMASANRVGTRTKQFQIGRRSTPENLAEKVQSLLSTGEWCVAMIHGITTGYDVFQSDTVLWDHLDYVKKLEDKIWVATFRDVAAYTAEQKSVRLKTAQKGKKWIVTPVCTLDNKLFKYPLTLVLWKSGIQKISAKQGGKKLAVEIRSDKALLEFNPHGGKITIQMN